MENKKEENKERTYKNDNIIKTKSNFHEYIINYICVLRPILITIIIVVFFYSLAKLNNENKTVFKNHIDTAKVKTNDTLK